MGYILSCLLNGQRINCFDSKYNKDQLKKWANKGILLCPACGKPYEYCHGKVRIPYFRHKDKSQCEDKYYEPETEEHLQGKRDLYEWIMKQSGVTDVILEGWIPETKQRPDIMFKYNGNQCVIEYQCSPISSEYYERHELYQAAGINDVWILGTDKYLEKEENEKSSRFRTKEIEYNTNFYYDSEFKIFNFKIIHDFEYEVISKLNDFNYKLISERKNFNNLISVNSIYNNQFSARLDNMIFNNRGIYFGDNIYNYLNNIKESIYNVKNILDKVILNLNKEYNLDFYRDRYSNYEIKYNNMCFEINNDKKCYRFCIFKFERDYSNYYRTKKYKWRYLENNEVIQNTDDIVYDSFISFVISILKQYKVIK